MIYTVAHFISVTLGAIQRLKIYGGKNQVFLSHILPTMIRTKTRVYGVSNLKNNSKMVFKININPKPILHIYFPKHNKELCWALSVLGATLLNKYLRGKNIYRNDLAEEN